jgi:hypothetical protein
MIILVVYTRLHEAARCAEIWTIPGGTRSGAGPSRISVRPNREDVRDEISIETRLERPGGAARRGEVQGRICARARDLERIPDLDLKG